MRSPRVRVYREIREKLFSRMHGGKNAFSAVARWTGNCIVCCFGSRIRHARLFTRTVSYLRDATRVPGLSIPRMQYRVYPSYPKCFPSGFKNDIILANTISDAAAILTKMYLRSLHDRVSVKFISFIESKYEKCIARKVIRLSLLILSNNLPSNFSREFLAILNKSIHLKVKYLVIDLSR